MTSLDTVHVDLAFRESHLQLGKLIECSIFALLFLGWSIFLASRLLHRHDVFLPPRLPYIVLLTAVLLNFAANIAAIAANVLDGSNESIAQPTSLIAAQTTFELAQFWAQTALFVAVCLVFFALTNPLGRPGRWGSGVVYTLSKFVFAFYAFAMFALATAAGAVSGDVSRKIRSVILGAPVIGNSILSPLTSVDMTSLLRENHAALNMTTYAFPALFIVSAFFVLAYAVSYFRALRRASEFMPAPTVRPFYSKAFVTLTAITYLLFAIAVFIFIFLFRFLTTDDGQVPSKLELASSIIYNWLFSCIVMLLSMLAIKWAPDTNADAVLNTVPIVPNPPPRNAAAAVEIPRAEQREREREEELVHA